MLFSILHILFIAFLVILIFNVLIIVHELGHFLAALWRGLTVEKFAIWFGKPLWKKKIKGVEYILGSIPAGGYVALPQMAPMEALEGESQIDRSQLQEATPLDKIIVAFAGPLFSFGLALFFALMVWIVGKPINRVLADTQVGYIGAYTLDLGVEPTEENPLPLKKNPVYEAGLRTGDRILRVDGISVKQWAGMGDSIQWHFVRSEKDTVPVTVQREGKEIPLEITPEYESKRFWQRSPLRLIPFTPPATPLMNQPVPNSPADLAGIQKGDLILSLNGQLIHERDEVIMHVFQNPKEVVTLGILRGDQKLSFRLKPTLPDQDFRPFPTPMLGVTFDASPEFDLVYPNPIEQVVDSVLAVVQTLDALFSPQSEINASHMSGPIGIMRVYGRMFLSEEGWRQVLWLSVLINVNLALVNLLPIPVLDGGHITFAIIEWIRRKPVNLRMMEIMNSACALILIGFMLYVTFFDVQDFGFKKRAPIQEIRFNPPTSSSNQL